MFRKSTVNFFLLWFSFIPIQIPTNLIGMPTDLFKVVPLCCIKRRFCMLIHRGRLLFLHLFFPLYYIQIQENTSQLTVTIILILAKTQQKNNTAKCFLVSPPRFCAKVLIGALNLRLIKEIRGAGVIFTKYDTLTKWQNQVRTPQDWARNPLAFCRYSKAWIENHLSFFPPVVHQDGGDLVLLTLLALASYYYRNTYCHQKVNPATFLQKPSLVQPTHRDALVMEKEILHYV